MRTLLLLRGIPGAGKSTFIREHHLEPYTLSPDDFRLKVSAPELNQGGYFEISQKHDHDAWTILYDAMELRMQRGDFTIIDATNCSPTMLAHYRKYVQKYRYLIFCLNFDVPLEQALKQNAEREEYKRVPEETIKRMYNIFRNTKPQNYIKRIDSIDEILNFWIDDLTDRYKSVRIIGDVHGCYTVLQQALGKELDPDIMYVFVGDLLERGIENRQMIDFILKHYKDKNVKFVMGNHDSYLTDWSIDSLPKDKHGKIRVPRSFEFMMNELLKMENNIGYLKGEIQNALRKFTQAYAFTFHGQKYLVNHGGVTSVPQMTLISTAQLMRGVGSYQFDVDKAYEESYKKDRCQRFIQIHGHRLADEFDNESYVGTEHSINLEGQVEFGGLLKICTITPEKLEVQKFKNEVYNHNWVADLIEKKDSQPKHREVEVVTENPEINKMIQNVLIQVKDLDDHNLISLNFTRDAFRKRIWNDTTIRARGLFVDKTTGDVKLRSYNKFFNLGERPETSKKVLDKKLAFPLKVYRKQNGFLGIMSVVDGDVILASKTTTHGPYADMFRSIYKTLDEQEKEALKQVAEKNHCSFVFEVCHVKDKHIIDFDQNHLWLLDAVQNEQDINGIDIDEDFSERMKEQIPIISGIMQKKVLLFEANSVDEVIAYAKKHHHDRTIEGVVCQDRNGYMFKLKFHYYQTIKKLRGAFQLAQSRFSNGIPWGTFRDERTIKFISYYSKKPYDEWRNLHIIDAVKQYEEANGLLMSQDE